MIICALDDIYIFNRCIFLGWVLFAIFVSPKSLNVRSWWGHGGDTTPSVPELFGHFRRISQCKSHPTDSHGVWDVPSPGDPITWSYIPYDIPWAHLPVSHVSWVGFEDQQTSNNNCKELEGIGMSHKTSAKGEGWVKCHEGKTKSSKVRTCWLYYEILWDYWRFLYEPHTLQRTNIG